MLPAMSDRPNAEAASDRSRHLRSSAPRPASAERDRNLMRGRSVGLMIRPRSRPCRMPVWNRPCRLFPRMTSPGAAGLVAGDAEAQAKRTLTPHDDAKWVNASTAAGPKPCRPEGRSDRRPKPIRPHSFELVDRQRQAKRRASAA